MTSGAAAEPAGELDGMPVQRFLLTGPAGVSASVLEYGAILERLSVPDRTGTSANVVLGLPGLAEYAADGSYFGAVVGRFANRIAGGRFPLDGRSVQLALNDPHSTVHSGTSGFHRKIWRGTTFETADRVGVSLDCVSPHGEEGFPCTVHARVTYALDRREPVLTLEYELTTDRPTIVNPTNHSFFNLNGEGSGDIRDHTLAVLADAYLPLAPTSLPLGEPAPVAGTPFDLRRPAPLGERMTADHPQVRLVDGIDHNFVLADSPGPLRHAARLASPTSGRVLDVWTTEPAIDVYTGNAFDADEEGAVHPYGRWAGIALETEHVSDSPNLPWAPPTVLRPGERFESTTVLRFGTAGP
ncbi:MAG: aldose epimerase family protein [Amnibacterium sp.]